MIAANVDFFERKALPERVERVEVFEPMVRHAP